MGREGIIKGRAEASHKVLTALSPRKYNPLAYFRRPIVNGRRTFPNPPFWTLLGVFLLICATLSLGGAPQRPADSFADLIRSGKSHFIRGEYEKARQSLQQAIRIGPGQKNPVDETDGLIKLALISWNLNSVPEARAYFQKGKDIAEKSKNRTTSRYCRMALAAIRFYEDGKRLKNEGKIQLSLQSYKHAILLAEAIGADDLIQKCLRSASVAFWYAADYERHYAWARRSLSYAQRLGLKRETCLCLHGIGVNLCMKGIYSEALKYIEMDLAILSELNDPSLEADCYNVIEIIFFAMGDFSRAYFYASKEKELLEKFGKIDTIHIPYGNAGMCLARQSLENNNLQGVGRGISILNQAVDLARARKDASAEAHMLNAIGFYYYRTGEYDAALSYLQRACDVAELAKKEMGITDDKKIALINIAMVKLETRNPQGAYDILSKLAVEGVGEFFKKNIWEVYYGLGLCEEKAGDDEAALSYYEKAAALIDEARKQISVDFYRAGFQRDKLMVYERIIDLFYKKYKAKILPGELLRLFMAVERVKARTFLESLSEQKSEHEDGRLRKVNPSGMPSSEKAVPVSGQLSIAEDLDVGPRTINEKLKREEDAAVRGLLSRRSRPQKRLGNMFFEEDIVGRLQKSMPDGRMAVLEYYLGKERSFLFLITKKSLKLFELPPGDVIRKSLRAVVKKIAEAEAGVRSYRKALDRLYDELLFPLRDADLTAIETLVIIPDGFLYHVPFEAASIDQSRKLSYAVEKYRISYAPSLTSLLYLLQQMPGKERRKEFLAIGNPAAAPSAKGGDSVVHSRLWSEFFFCGRPEFGDLPFSEEEAVDLAGRFPSGSSDVLLGDNAQEKTVKTMALGDYRLIHFACHAVLDPESAFRSALLLAPDGTGEEDGFLQVSEIYGLRMDADLVVLSACQTARGILQRGEGVFGLSRIFFHAGARAVLSTLWPVSDKPSAVFMKKFYRYLVEGLSKSEAVRLAKLDMIRSKYAHPAYWAAYVLNGDYRASYPH
jgi:CHAT domain-containing protein